MTEKDILKEIEDFVNGELPDGFVVSEVKFYPEHKSIHGYINYTGGRLSREKEDIIIAKIENRFGLNFGLNPPGVPL